MTTGTTTPAKTTQKPMTRRDLEARIVAKAWKDPAYKQRLTSDPKGVLQEELKNLDPSITLPNALKVQVHQEDPNVFHLVVPRNPSEITLGEVVGDNLEAVAPQTIAVVLAAVVAAGTVVTVTHLAAANVVAAANVTVTANAAANSNAVA